MDHLTRYGHGSNGYRAPELMEGEYTTKVDIWAMGCILYELATGKRAFENDWAVLKYRNSGKNMVTILDDTFDTQLIAIITKHIADMLQIEAPARPSASILSADFVRQYRLSQIDSHIGVQSSKESNSVTLLPIPNESKPIAPVAQQQHQVVATEADGYTQTLPLRIVGVSLYSWAAKGDLEAVKMLLNAKADVNVQGEYYGNPLQAASASGNKGMVQLLLENGADVNAQGGYYSNALQAASASGNKGVVQLLLEKGADVNVQGGYYGNALQAASVSGNKGLVQLLLEKGVDVNAQGGFYGNALSAASKLSHDKVVQLLLGNGAKLQTRKETKQ